jgi:hypothetical protein
MINYVKTQAYVLQGILEIGYWMVLLNLTSCAEVLAPTDAALERGVVWKLSLFMSLQASRTHDEFVRFKVC